VRIEAHHTTTTTTESTVEEENEEAVETVAPPRHRVPVGSRQPGGGDIKLFSFITDDKAQLARGFALEHPFQ
jgi:hypothetical protein